MTEQDTTTRVLRKRSPLKQMRLNFAKISNGGYNHADFGFSEEEEIKKPKKKKSKIASKRARKQKFNYGDDYEDVGYAGLDIKKKPKPAKKEKEPDNNLNWLIGWRNTIKMVEDCNDQKLGKIMNVPKLSKVDFSKTVKDLQAIYINIQWGDEEKERQSQLAELRNLQLENRKILRNGIIFIWTDKQLMDEIMNVMDSKGFVYIENFSIIYLSLQACEEKLITCQGNKKQEKNLMSYFNPKQTKKNNSNDKETQIKKLDSIQDLQQRKQRILDNLDDIKEVNIDDLILKSFSTNYRKSKKILLMFRRQCDKDVQLELRHQRTSDVVFDLVDENDPDNLDQKMQEYTYQMIETLLPKARVGVENNNFKMMEIFADHQKTRQHWLGYSSK